MPKDQPFALRDILPILQKAEPHRKFIEATVLVVFKRLIDDGEVGEVRRATMVSCSGVAAGCAIEEIGPLATVSIADAIEYVLRRRKANATGRDCSSRTEARLSCGCRATKTAGRYGAGIQAEWQTVRVWTGWSLVNCVMQLSCLFSRHYSPFHSNNRGLSFGAVSNHFHRELEAAQRIHELCWVAAVYLPRLYLPLFCSVALVGSLAHLLPNAIGHLR